MDDSPLQALSRSLRERVAGIHVPSAVGEGALNLVARMIPLVVVLMTGLVLPAAMVLRAARNLGLIAGYPVQADGVELLGMSMVAAAVLILVARLGLERPVVYLAFLLMSFMGYTVVISTIGATVLMALISLVLWPFGMQAAWDPLYLLNAAGWTPYGIYVWYDWLTATGRHVSRDVSFFDGSLGAWRPASSAADRRVTGASARSAWTSHPDGSTWTSTGSGWSSDADDDRD